MGLHKLSDFSLYTNGGDLPLGSRQCSPIPIVMHTDDNYVVPTIVTTTSILKNHERRTKYIIYILGNNLSSQNIERLSRFKDVQVIQHQDRFSKVAKAKSHCTTTDLFKFDLPEVFPQYDKILYLDVDMIIQHDLADLYNTDITEYYAAVVKDMPGMVSENCQSFVGLTDYFNAGMMLLNLKKMREDNIAEKLIDYKPHKDRGAFMSQDALNAIFGTAVKYVSPFWNYMAPNLLRYSKKQIAEFFGLSKKQYNTICRKAAVVHLTNKLKPWNSLDAWGAKLWYTYYMMSPLKNERWFYAESKKYIDEVVFPRKKLKDYLFCVDKDGRNCTYLLFNSIPVFKKITFVYNDTQILKIKKYLFGIRYRHYTKDFRPVIALIYDYPDWILGRWAKNISLLLGHKYRFLLTSIFDVCSREEYYKKLFKQVDLVHPMAPHQYSLFRSLTDKEKILVTIHHWLNYNDFAKTFTDCRHILCCSSQWKNGLLEQGIPSEKVSMILNGIEERFLQVHTPLYPKKDGKIHIGFFAKASSNSDDRKGTRHFIAVVKKIKERNLCHRFHFYISGKGWENFVAQIEADGASVTYNPFVSDEDMPRLYHSLDFYLMLSDVEGGPVTVLEAMASKVAVLANNIGIVQDIGRDKENILLIRPQETDDIINKILALAENQQEYQKIIDKAYETVSEMTYDKTFAPLEEVYDSLLVGRSFINNRLQIERLNAEFAQRALSVKDSKDAAEKK